jgi:hypothetical protein
VKYFCTVEITLIKARTHFENRHFEVAAENGIDRQPFANVKFARIFLRFGGIFRSPLRVTTAYSL